MRARLAASRLRRTPLKASEGVSSPSARGIDNSCDSKRTVPRWGCTGPPKYTRESSGPFHGIPMPRSTSATRLSVARLTMNPALPRSSWFTRNTTLLWKKGSITWGVASRSTGGVSWACGSCMIEIIAQTAPRFCAELAERRFDTPKSGSLECAFPGGTLEAWPAGLSQGREDQPVQHSYRIESASGEVLHGKGGAASGGGQGPRSAPGAARGDVQAAQVDSRPGGVPGHPGTGKGRGQGFALPAGDAQCGRRRSRGAGLQGRGDPPFGREPRPQA